MIYNLDGEIRVKTFGHISQRKGAWHSGQRSAHSTLVYCTDGEFSMNVEGEVFHVRTGDVLLIPRGSLFIPLDGGACKYYVLNFSAETVEGGNIPKRNASVTAHVNLEDGYAYSVRGEYSSLIEVRKITKNAPLKVKTLFEKAKKLNPGERFYDQLLLDQLARELLVSLSDEKTRNICGRLSEILEYIEHNYSDALTLSTLSERFSLSESYISRLFKNELGIKPSEYINNARISAAETLLLTTDKSIAEIAERVGYSDVYYFSKTFKKLVGCSPSKMRWSEA